MRQSIAAAVLGILVSAEMGASSAKAAPRPHVVFLLADDLGWGDVGYHGSMIRTPNIDRLAKAGVRLEQFYVQPLCSPTRAALLTGRYPLRYGLQCGVVRPWAQYGLPLDERTLPQALKAAGYATAIVGKWHIGHVSRDYLPMRRGFDLQYGHYNGMLDYFTHIRDGGHDWHRNDKANYDKGYTTDLIADEAVRIITKQDPKKPLFLYVPFNAPHTPLQVPEKWLKPYAGMANRQRQIYAGMVACLDDAIGRIVAAAGKHLPAEKTLFVFCSDNGGVPRLGSNGKLRAGKGTLYEGGVRVPAVMVWKGVLPAGKVVKEPLHLVDIYPTVVKLAGGSLKQTKPLDGHDLWPVITAGKPRASSTIVQNVTPFHAAIRAGDWKLIHNGHVGVNTTTETKKVRRGKWELFNVKDDPSESRDRSAEGLPEFEQIRKQIETLRRQMAKPNIPPNRPPAEFRAPKVWGETAKR